MAISLECNARTYVPYELKVRNSICKNAQTVEENNLKAASEAELQAATDDTKQQSGSRSLGPGELS